MDYDFSRLSARSFEHLVQAIAAEVLTPGISVFGDGPDGGREATYEGPLHYPSPEDHWDGYTVIQAKFRQRTGDPSVDGSWVLAQLNGELEAFEDSTTTRRRPDNYLFVTNLDLSSVTDSGGKDRAVARMRESTLGLVGFDVWDYSQLRTYLDIYDGIRRTYGAWVMPGDVLARMVEALPSPSPGFETVLANYLQKRLIADQYANLEQAGRAADERIPISKVFVDLPITAAPAGFSAVEGADGHAGFVQELVRRADDKFPGQVERDVGGTGAPDSKPEEDQTSLLRGNRHVLIGGPGQGKTTVGQFICQLYRAALLNERPAGALSEEGRTALSEVLTFSETEGIELPKGRRFPLQIPLNRFAAALASTDGPSSLLEYLVQDVATTSGYQVDPGSFREWLSSYPWIVVLDGLDEVPSSSNRDSVLAAVRDFWVDAAQAHSDVFVLATSRPQGYNDEFSPRTYQHSELAPLSPARALEYARRLTGVRFAGDEPRQVKINSRLERAARTDATARLMQSPLQVTIMATLVDRMGQPPQERWSLFHHYYETIYQREVERDIPAAEVLRDYRPDIDAIHFRVGLLLQVESEEAEQTEARLPADRLDAVVEQRLIGEGHDPDVRGHLREKIREAAEERLVFLVGLEAGQVGFEIRSLQEFMAAECLMDTGDEIAARRMRQIAGVPAWRNVFLFAAGKCFTQRQHLRDTVHTIAAQLNESVEDSASRLSAAGGLLALDLLHDGPPRHQPRYSELLARQALRVLELPPSTPQVRLATAYEPRLQQLYEETIRAGLSKPVGAERLGAWNCLLHLEQVGWRWAAELVTERWGDADLPASGLVQIAITLPDASPRRAAICADLACLSVSELSDIRGRLSELEDELPPEVSLALSLGAYPDERIDVALTNDFRLTLLPVAARRGEAVLAGSSKEGADWDIVRTFGAFSEDPTAEGLAYLLDAVAVQGLPVPDSLAALPWPATACVAFAPEPEALKVLAQRAREGALGGPEDWLAAEERWRSRGSERPEYGEFMCAADGEVPFDERIAERGIPLVGTGWAVSTEAAAIDGALREVWHLLDECTESNSRGILSSWLLMLGGIPAPNDADHEIERWTQDQLERILADSAAHRWATGPRVLERVQWQSQASAELLSRLDQLGEAYSYRYYVVPVEGVGQAFLDSVAGGLDRSGVRRLSALALAADSAVVRQSPQLDELAGDTDDAASLIAVKRNASSDEAEAALKRLARTSDRSLYASAVEVLRARTAVQDARRPVSIFSEGISPEDWQRRRDSQELLADAIGHRPSGLRDPTTWSELSLFEPAPG